MILNENPNLNIHREIPMKKLLLILAIFTLLTLQSVNISRNDSRDRDYCESTWNNATDDWITNVQFNTIDNSTEQDGGDQSYGDYTSTSSEVFLGETYEFSMSWYSDGFIQYGKVWFDWNSDEIFDDELEGYEVGFGADMTLTTSITVPWDAVADTSRMRVSEGYNQYPTPCNDEAIQWGETEDYTIIISGEVQEPGILNGLVSLNGGTGIVEEVSILINNTEEHPDAEGNYAISLMPGVYNLQASFENFYTLNIENIIIESDSTESLDLALQFIESHSLPYLETFNAGLPEDWEVIDFENDGFSWNIISGYEGESLNGSQFSFVNSDAAGDNNTHLLESLISPVIQCDSANVLILSFDSYYRQRGNQTGHVEVWDGEQWQELIAYSSSGGFWNTPSLEVIDITEYKNDQLRIKFLFDDSAEWNWFWAVDNVHIYEAETGIIEGYVYEVGTTNPINEATIEAGNYNTTSNEEGFYQFQNIPVGTYTLHCSKPYFVSETSDEILVEIDQTSIHDFYLGWAEMGVTPDVVDMNIPWNYPDYADLTITNTGNEPLEYYAYLQSEYVNPYPSTSACAVAYFEEEGVYKFIIFDADDPEDYNVINSAMPNTITAACFMEIEYNMFGLDSNNEKLVQISLNYGSTTEIADCPIPLENGSWIGMASNRINDKLYALCSDLTQTNLYEINPVNGNTTLISELGISSGTSLAIDYTGYGYCLDLDTDALYKINLQSGEATLVGEIGFDANFNNSLSWNAESDQLYLGVINDGTSEFRLLNRTDATSELTEALSYQIVAFGFRSSWMNWVTIEPAYGTVQPGLSQSILLTFNPSYFETYTQVDGYIVIENRSNNVPGDDFLVDISMFVDYPDANEETEVAPVISQLLGNYPNPFNPSGAGRGPTTEIRFSLNTEITEKTEIEIFNVKGQKIVTLSVPQKSEYIEGRQTDSTYSITWNGQDQNNHPVSSGIYFYKLKVGNRTIDTRKMMLIK